MEQRNQIVNIPQFRKRNNANDKLQESLQDPQQDKATEETSDDEMRIQFHLQGFSGPDTYRYGFHTADPYNPLERFEERDGEGHVRGHYSYVGPTGKRVTVNYAADQNGFRIVADESSGVGGKASGSSDNNQDEESDDGRSASGGSGGSSNNNEQDGSTAMGHSPDENYDSDNNRL
ncbi:hypothetical protein BIW11_04312 [Tropilaelaps mercedesae]|uniref:Cuticle protein 10.9-like n=1 Tax=Tropilaelaps mercedesae TaxID=418985 RepID=A0A1V9X8I3_9ACAR|nr:hypothetical protein BIW11_04312 [Tropilaelaps mercedesae]